MYNIVDKHGYYLHAPRIAQWNISQDDFLKCKLVSSSRLASQFTFEDAVTFQAGLHRLTAWQLHLSEVSA
jgi:hypothetical protein